MAAAPDASTDAPAGAPVEAAPDASGTPPEPLPAQDASGVANFTGLVLGCIETKFCKKTCV